MQSSTSYAEAQLEYEKAYGIKVDGTIGAVNTTAGYTVFKDGARNRYSITDGSLDQTIPQKDNKIWNVGMSFDVAKDLKLTADYLKSNVDDVYGSNGTKSIKFDGDDGVVVGLNYKGAKASVPGSYGIYANYYDQSRGTVIAHTMNGVYGYLGFEGYMIGMNYTLAKNIVASLEWYDLTQKSVVKGDKKYPDFDMETLWAQVVFTF